MDADFTRLLIIELLDQSNRKDNLATELGRTIEAPYRTASLVLASLAIALDEALKKFEAHDAPH